MSKRSYGIMLLAATVMILSGCSGSKGNTVPADTAAETTVIEETQETPADEKNEVAVGAVECKPVVYQLGTKTFAEIGSGLSTDNKAYFRFKDKETEKYGIMDASGECVINPVFEKLEVGADTVFGYYPENGEYMNIIFNAKMEPVKAFSGPIYKIRSCNEGIAAFSSDEEPWVYLYKHLESSNAAHFSPMDRVYQYVRGSAFHDGYAIVSVVGKEGETAHTYFMDPTGRMERMNYLPVRAEKEEPVEILPTEHGMALISDDYWLMYAESTDGQKNANAHSPYGFYNLYARKNYYFPEGYGEKYDWQPLMRVPAGTDLFIKDSYIVMNEQPHAEEKKLRVYDIGRQAFASADSFAELVLDDLGSGHVLCKTADGKWGWLSGDWKPEAFHDAASSFGGGYALAADNGKCVIVNDALQVVSNEMEAEEVFFLQADDANVYFALMDPKAGGYRILRVEK